MRIDFADLHLAVREAMSAPGEKTVEDETEIWKADLQGVVLGVAFNNERDTWLIRGQGWSVCFTFDWGVKADELDGPDNPDLVRFGVWGRPGDIEFKGDPDAYLRDMTLLKVVLPRDNDMAPSRVREVEPS